MSAISPIMRSRRFRQSAVLLSFLHHRTVGTNREWPDARLPKMFAVMRLSIITL